MVAIKIRSWKSRNPGEVVEVEEWWRRRKKKKKEEEEDTYLRKSIFMFRALSLRATWSLP